MTCITSYLLHTQVVPIYNLRGNLKTNKKKKLEEKKKKKDTKK